MKPHSSQQKPTKIPNTPSCHCSLTQKHNNCRETDLGVSEAFCLPMDQHCLNTQPDYHGQYSSQETPTKILSVVRSDHHCALTVSCRKSPWRQVVSATVSYCLPSGSHFSLDSNSMAIKWVIGTCHKLATYNHTGSLWTRLNYELVDAKRVCPKSEHGY